MKKDAIVQARVVVWWQTRQGESSAACWCTASPASADRSRSPSRTSCRRCVCRSTTPTSWSRAVGHTHRPVSTSWDSCSTSRRRCLAGQTTPAVQRTAPPTTSTSLDNKWHRMGALTTWPMVDRFSHNRPRIIDPCIWYFQKTSECFISCCQRLTNDSEKGYCDRDINTT